METFNETTTKRPAVVNGCFKREGFKILTQLPREGFRTYTRYDNMRESVTDQRRVGAMTALHCVMTPTFLRWEIVKEITGQSGGTTDGADTQ